MIAIPCGKQVEKRAGRQTGLVSVEAATRVFTYIPHKTQAYGLEIFKERN